MLWTIEAESLYDNSIMVQGILTTTRNQDCKDTPSAILRLISQKRYKIDMVLMRMCHVWSMRIGKMRLDDIWILIIDATITHAATFAVQLCWSRWA